MVTHFWGRCQSQIGSPLGSLAAALLGLSLLFQSPAVSADSTPYPARLNSQAYYGTLYVSPMFPTTLQACEWLVGNWPNTSSPFFTNDYPPGQGYAGGICYASQNGGGPIGFGLWKRYTDCPKGGQVDDATVATPMCSCPAGWMFPPGGPVPGGPVCVPNTCPVEPLTPIDQLQPNGPDVLPLTQLLERTRGADLALTPETETARQCLIGKASGAGVTVRTTSGTRTIAYQKHFIEIWNKMMEHNNYEDDPVVWEACRSRREEIIAEKGCSSSQGCIGACTPGSHCIRAEPATDSRHPDGRAFDVSMDTINGLRTNLAARQPPQSISELLTSTPACSLTWGGGFNNPDDVHFQQ